MKKLGITLNCAVLKFVLLFEYPTWSLNVERILKQCSFCLISEDVNGSVPTLIQVTKKQDFFLPFLLKWLGSQVTHEFSPLK